MANDGEWKITVRVDGKEFKITGRDQTEVVGKFYKEYGRKQVTELTMTDPHGHEHNFTK